MKSLKIYLAGPLFSLAQRDFNSLLVNALKRKIPNCTISLPQEYAKTIIGKAAFVEDMFNYCVNLIAESDVIVAVLDGPDADSGTCVEIGYAYSLKKPIIGIRTDLRASEDRGVNLMVSKACTEIIWLRNSSVKLDHVIDEVIRAIERLPFLS